MTATADMQFQIQTQIQIQIQIQYHIPPFLAKIILRVLCLCNVLKIDTQSTSDKSQLKRITKAAVLLGEWVSKVGLPRDSGYAVYSTCLKFVAHATHVTANPLVDRTSLRRKRGEEIL